MSAAPETTPGTITQDSVPEDAVPEDAVPQPVSRRDGRDDVRGISDLAQRIVTSTYLEHPRLHRGLVIALGVLLASCLLATVVRLSPLPLLPLPLLAAGAYALRRGRSSVGDNRQLLIWTSVFLFFTLLAFWLMSVVARWLD